MSTDEQMTKSTGTVINFLTGRGFGFIQPEGTTEDDDQIFVHWKDLVSDDNYPRLTKGLEVQFTIADGKDGKKCAKQVTLPGGENIVLEGTDEEMDHSDATYLGTVKFWDGRKGFGYITCSEKVEYDGVTVEAGDDVWAGRQFVVSSDERHRLMRNQEVKFHVFKAKKGDLSCFKVTDPNGEPLTYTPKAKRKDVPEDEEEETEKAAPKKAKKAKKSKYS